MGILLFSLLFIGGASISNAKIVDFDTHFKSWCVKQAKALQRNLKWCDAYGRHRHLVSNPEYHQYQIKTEYKNMQYYPAVRDIAKPGFTFEEWYHNGGSVPLIGRFSKTKSLTSSFSWSITEGLKIGTENSFKVGVPGIVGGDIKFKAELELKSTQAKTKTTTDTFTVENEIPVAPKKSVKAVFSIIEREVEVPWTADVYIRGAVAIWLNPKFKNHWLWFYDARTLQNEDFVLAGDGLRYKAKGIFNGVRGFETILTTQECDYQTVQETGECVSRSPPQVVHRKIWH